MRNSSKVVIAGLAAGIILSACASTGSSPSNAKAENGLKSLDPILGIMMTGEGRDAEQFETQLAAAKANPLGSAKNPVRVWRPAGQRQYLSRLICENGDSPKFSRDGSFGAGPYRTILDRYSVECGGETTPVFMDMYHLDHEENEAVPGFTIKIDMGSSIRT